MKRPTLALLCAAHFLLLILHSSVVAAQPKPFAGYLFAYFEGGGDKNLQEQLRFAISEDARNWYALNDNRPIVASDSIS
ncbi:MAG: 1,4-beta-xylanase, partial [Bacteroidaceae bacterium]|nr:1,4-beta-xylanase [Bacteroidaceae bacterium]